MAGKRKILLMSDDLRMHSGIATQSKEFVMGTLHHYDWVQIGGAVKHPENGKIVDDVYIVLENIRCQSTGDTLKDKFNVVGKMCTNDHNELKTNGYISFNGSYKINFGYPFFVWENTKDLKLII